MKTKLTYLFLAVLLAWGVWDYIQDHQTKAVGTSVGNQIPDFTLETPGGGTLDLSDYKGQKIVINFWASWCAPCKEETPDLVKLYKNFKGQNMTVISINATTSEIQKDDVKKFLDHYHLPFPVGLDKKGKMIRLFHVKGYPTTFFVNTRGIIQYKHEGVLKYNQFERYLRLLD